MNSIRKMLCSIAVALTLLGVGTVVKLDKAFAATAASTSCSEAECTGSYGGSEFTGVCTNQGCYGCNCTNFEGFAQNSCS